MITIDNYAEMETCRGTAGQEQNPGKRIDKVRQIRHKIKSGKYNPDEHLSIAVDRLIEKILMQNSENPARVCGSKISRK